MRGYLGAPDGADSLAGGSVAKRADIGWSSYLNSSAALVVTFMIDLSWEKPHSPGSQPGEAGGEALGMGDAALKTAERADDASPLDDIDAVVIGCSHSSCVLGRGGSAASLVSRSALMSTYSVGSNPTPARVSI